MKRIVFVIITLCVVIATHIHAQGINWQSMPKQNKSLLHINTGYDYGLVYGAGYAYRIKTKPPILLHGTYSFPSGKKLFDDFKVRIGAQGRLFQYSYFTLSARAYGIYRRYQNDVVRMQNFGSELGLTAGYYRKHWFVAATIGFDKAIATHFKHSTTYKELYSAVQDGWYEPATGGNYRYGLEAGISFLKSDIVLSGGKMVEQDFQSDYIIPFYAQLSWNYKL